MRGTSCDNLVKEYRFQSTTATNDIIRGLAAFRGKPIAFRETPLNLRLRLRFGGAASGEID